MISKELLKSITEMKIGYIREEDKGKTIAYASRFPNGEFWNNHRINIYELAYKCKSWAMGKGYVFFPRYKIINGYVFELLELEHFLEGWKINIKADTELEAIFKACEWILNENNIKSN